MGNSTTGKNPKIDHVLKCDPHIFDLVLHEEFQANIRYNDRNFKRGDNILLRETKHTGEEMSKRNAPLHYTGRDHLVEVTAVIQAPPGETLYGLKEGWCLLGLCKLGV